MKIQILEIGLNETIPTILSKHLNWNVTFADTAEEAVEKFQQVDFDVVAVLEGFLIAEQEAMLKKLMALKNHDSLWITFNEKTEGDLVKAIEAFLEEKERAPKSTVSVIDNGSKRPDITIE